MLKYGVTHILGHPSVFPSFVFPASSVEKNINWMSTKKFLDTI